jgi:hypothetical protein
MQTPQLIAIAIGAIVVLILVAAIAWSAGQRRRSQRLQDRFGPEYERTVASAEDRGKAEAELEARQDRVEALQIRPLDAQTREAFAERWRVIQTVFVDDPRRAVADADDLVGEVMTKRGYPMGDFEQRAADISVDHPYVVDHYRTAHRIALAVGGGEGDTEQLRQAMLHYRALAADLLDIPDRGVGADAAAEPVSAGAAPAPVSTDVSRPMDGMRDASTPAEPMPQPGASAEPPAEVETPAESRPQAETAEAETTRNPR